MDERFPYLDEHASNHARYIVLLFFFKFTNKMPQKSKYLIVPVYHCFHQRQSFYLFYYFPYMWLSCYVVLMLGHLFSVITMYSLPMLDGNMGIICKCIYFKWELIFLCFHPLHESFSCSVVQPYTNCRNPQGGVADFLSGGWKEWGKL